MCPQVSDVDGRRLLGWQDQIRCEGREVAYREFPSKPRGSTDTAAFTAAVSGGTRPIDEPNTVMPIVQAVLVRRSPRIWRPTTRLSKVKGSFAE